MLEIEYNSITDQTFGTGCGGYTNTIKYIDGPAFDGAQEDGADFSSQFSFSALGADGTLRMTGKVSDPVWVGVHQLQIQSRNGVFAPGSERGADGLFGASDSEIFTLTVVDPCLSDRISTSSTISDVVYQIGVT